MWRHEDIFFALGQGIDALTGERVAPEYSRAPSRQPPHPTGLVFCVIPPLMHGAAQIATLSQWFLGSTLVLIRKFDPEPVWGLFEAEGVNSVLHHRRRHGQAADGRADAQPDRWDLSA